MGEVIQLFEEAPAPSVAQAWMMDSQRPILPAFSSVYPIFDKIQALMPPQSLRGDQGKGRLFVPFSRDGEPVWFSGFDQISLNHPYLPYHYLYYCIRDRNLDLFEAVQGAVIGEREFLNMREELSNLLNRIVLGRGSRPNGMASEDEVLRVASLFFMLCYSCQGQNLFVEGESFNCHWNGQTNVIDVGKRFWAWGQRLKQCYVANLPYHVYLSHYMDKTKKGDMWYWSLEVLDETMNGVFRDDKISLSRLMEVLKIHPHLVTARGAEFMIVIPLAKDWIAGLKKFGEPLPYLDRQGQEIWSLKDGTYARFDVAPHSRLKGTSYCILTSYLYTPDLEEAL